MVEELLAERHPGSWPYDGVSGEVGGGGTLHWLKLQHAHKDMLISQPGKCRYRIMGNICKMCIPFGKSL